MMSSLFSYMQQVQRFLRDSKQEIFDPGDLIYYVNMARREVAMRAQCIRVLPPISGAITNGLIINGGSDYTNPTVRISAPDSPGGHVFNPNGAQATAIATQLGGVINNFYVQYGGSGYFQPTIQIDDPTGTGAEIQPILSPILTANNYQEVYAFKDIPLDTFGGVESVYAVLSVSLIYANSRYSVLMYSFSQYQALIRQYSAGAYYYIPCLGCQFGRGRNGSLYLYPPPSQVLQLEIDCMCLPMDLQSDRDFEAIPEPWTDAVPYYAAHLAMIEAQNHNSARSFLAMFDDRMKRFGAYTLPGRAISQYGRP